ncbi:MAG: PadR family transcriptional regulator [Acidobacteria bacterium]|nr:PadR family transcriptional regulator [Acidobacteriota bacterium]
MVVLKTLARGPNHGFGVALQIQDTSEGLLRVDEGSLYPALHRLEKRGLLSADWKTTPNGRRAKIYKLTPAGRKRLEDVERTWLTLARGVHLILEAK